MRKTLTALATAATVDLAIGSAAERDSTQAGSMSALPEIPKELLAPRTAAVAKGPRREPGWELFLVVRVIQVLIIGLLWLVLR